MSAIVCGVGGCESPTVQGSPWCSPHRARYYRYGDPTGKPPPRRRDLAGQRFGMLVAVEYSEVDRKWRCRCDCGLETLVVSSSLLSGCTRSCGRRRRHIVPASYEQAHAHVRAIRGDPAEHRCGRCDRRPAEHWAYRRRGAARRENSPLGPWSPDPADYEPLCVGCHKRGDLAAINEERAAEHGAQRLW